MSPTSLFPDAQLASLHQQDLRATAARARLARIATRGFGLERIELRSVRRAALRPVTEASPA
jgi:hypothetical protein